MPDIKVIDKWISLTELRELAKQRFGDMIKAVVDIQKNIIAVGGEFHADEEALLLEQGSNQTNLWGINIYVNQPKDSWIEYDSIINLRPSQGNSSRGIESPEIRQAIIKIVNQLIN